MATSYQTNTSQRHASGPVATCERTSQESGVPRPAGGNGAAYKPMLGVKPTAQEFLRFMGLAIVVVGGLFWLLGEVVPLLR